MKAAVKGVVKTISKMGISSIQSYCGAQIFEALGIHQSVIDKYFSWTPSRIGGIGLDVIAEEAELRHAEGYPGRLSTAATSKPAANTSGGTTANFTCSTRAPSTPCSRPARRGITDCSSSTRNRWTSRPPSLGTLRGLLEFKFAANADPARGSRAGGFDLPSLQDGRHELRLDQPGGARGAGDRDEPHRRQEQHRRRRRRPGALPRAAERRFEAEAPSSRWPRGALA